MGTYADQVKGGGRVRFHMLIAKNPLEGSVNGQNGETQMAKLLCAVLACGCTAYSDQVKGLGHTSFHTLLTHNTFRNTVGDRNVETQVAMIFDLV